MRLHLKGGRLRDDEGRQVARIVKAEVEIDDEFVQALVAEAGGTIGGASVVVEKQQSLLEESKDGEGCKGGAETTKTTKPTPGMVEAVLTHYVAVMEPRGGIDRMGPDDKAVVRQALAVSTVEECCRAIDGCFSSDYHMRRGEHKNRKGRKYNTLSQILKGRRGQETTRERIDFFIERAEEARAPGGTFPSADPAIVNRKKLDVQRGWRFNDNPDAQAKAEESKAWLAEHGVETVYRSEDGYPHFRAMTSREDESDG